MLVDKSSPPVECSERARQREIAAYLSAASYPAGLPSGPPAEPIINGDHTLNALVQLGTLRLDCDRSFLSLIDRENHFLAAEMTRSHSLLENRSADNDHIFLGVCKLETRWGVCPTAMFAFMDETGEWVQSGPNVIANKTRFIINDFRIDPDFVERPYVAGYPYMVSYMEIPLISPLGYLLGSYCVVDNRPRDFNNDKSINIMNEIASGIMSYLELKKTEQMRHRSEQLINSLSAFVGSEPTALPARPGPNNLLEGEQVSFDSVGTENTETFTNLTSESLDFSLAMPEVSSASSLQSCPDASPSLRDTPGRLAKTLSDGIGESPLRKKVATGGKDDPAKRAPTSTRGVPGSQDNGFSSTANLRSTFFRAAAMMRQAMDMDGFMFLDAAPSVYVDTSESPDSDHSRSPLRPFEAEGPSCAVIAHATVDCEGDTTTQSSQPRLSEVTLQRLIRRYPRGHVFSADVYGPIDEHYRPGKRCPSGRRASADSIGVADDVATLFHVLPAAKYIIFLPLWHFQRECWYIAALGWVADPTRAIEVADISLVSAFGNSVMAEVSRWEALAASRAKSNFVSSISHELRSPLHGVLASSELLREGISDPSLKPALDMLDSCGLTLLDTFNHLLNHAIAINAGKSHETPVADLQIADLGEMVEDVVETVKASYGFENAFRSSALLKRAHPADLSKAERHLTERPPLVTLRIEERSNWKMPTDVGAWKRIIMNIFGNALKYTASGRIEVSLQVTRKSDSQGRLRDYVSLSVEDTGVGISSDYLKYQLFTPFSQENSHASGMGLGLSIVQQLARGLGGTVNVKSSIGVGTMVEILVPFEQDSPDTVSLATLATTNYGQASNGDDEQKQLLGRTVCLITPEAYASVAKTCFEVTSEVRNRSAIVERALRDNTGGNLGMNVVIASADSLVPEADIYLFDDNMTDDSGSLAIFLSRVYSEVSPLILLCSAAGLPRQTPRHLLLVDDNPINIKLLTTVMRKLNHTFATACDGLEAVQLYEKSLVEGPRFDLVFMDISMPVMDGFEATREIRRLENKAGVAKSKIIVLTGLSSDSDRKEAVASGSDMFLTKPVKLVKVREVLDQEL
ncbi:hypothetical protein ACHAQH_004518 [Verticillium albo-atrum]